VSQPATTEGERTSRRSWIDWPFLLALSVVVIPVLAGIYYLTRGFSEDEAGLMARVARSDHPMIAEVSRSGDTDHFVIVRLVGSATDQDARDVWCEVIGQTAIDWHLKVSVETRMRAWPAPAHCSDPSDIPAAT
jgi:hypothetical protein